MSTVSPTLNLELEAIERELARTMPKGIKWVLIVLRQDGAGSACSSLDLDEAASVELMHDMAATIEANEGLTRQTMVLSGMKGGSS